MTPRPSHAHLTVQMQSSPFDAVYHYMYDSDGHSSQNTLSVYTLNIKVYTEKHCDMVNFEYKLLKRHNSF